MSVSSVVHGIAALAVSSNWDPNRDITQAIQGGSPQMPPELVREIEAYVDFSDYLNTAPSNEALLACADRCSPRVLDLSPCAFLDQTTLWMLLEKFNTLESLSIPPHLRAGILFAISYVYGEHTVRAAALLLRAPGVEINAKRYDPEPGIEEDQTAYDDLKARMSNMMLELRGNSNQPAKAAQLGRLQQVFELFLAHGARSALGMQ